MGAVATLLSGHAGDPRAGDRRQNSYKSNNNVDSWGKSQPATDPSLTRRANTNPPNPNNDTKLEE